MANLMKAVPNPESNSSVPPADPEVVAVARRRAVAGGVESVHRLAHQWQLGEKIATARVGLRGLPGHGSCRGEEEYLRGTAAGQAPSKYRLENASSRFMSWVRCDCA